jgi:hypothetical protein
MDWLEWRPDKTRVLHVDLLHVGSALKGRGRNSPGRKPWVSGSRREAALKGRSSTEPDLR